LPRLTLGFFLTAYATTVLVSVAFLVLVEPRIEWARDRIRHRSTTGRAVGSGLSDPGLAEITATSKSS
jgi:hypothetical protein